MKNEADIREKIAYYEGFWNALQDVKRNPKLSIDDVIKLTEGHLNDYRWVLNGSDPEGVVEKT